MPPRSRLALLAILPLPVLWLSMAIPKLAAVYNDPRFERPLLAGLCAAAVTGIAAAIRVCRGSARRAAWLAGIVATAALLAWNIFRTNPVRIGALREVVHIGEYGALGGFALRLLAPLVRGRGGYVAALCYGALVGIADELVQFYHPLRVGDLRDVTTDAFSALLGIAFVANVAGRRVDPGPDRATRRAAWAASGALASGLVAFHGVAESGYLAIDPAAGSFRSRLTAEALRARAASGDAPHYRALQQRDDRHPVFAIEDFYLSEARAHITTRDAAPVAAGLCENRVLETYYRPALVAQRRDPGDPASGAEWSAARVAQETAAAGPPLAGFAATYQSPCFRDLDTRHPPSFYLLVAPLPLLAALCVATVTGASGPMR